MKIREARDFALSENTYQVIDIQPKLEYQTSNQKTDKDTGLPLWSVVALRRENGVTEQFSVSVPSTEAPPMGQLTFNNLVLHYLPARGEGAWTGIYLTADSVEEAE